MYCCDDKGENSLSEFSVILSLYLLYASLIGESPAPTKSVGNGDAETSSLFMGYDLVAK
jgi:hypothetical protein